MTNLRAPGLLKSNPASFIVQELVGSKEIPVPLHTKSCVRGRVNQNTHTIFHLVKKGVTTYDAIREVAKQFDVSLSSVSRYGLKDRHAHTSQCIAVRGMFRPRFYHPNIVLCQQEGSLRPLRPGGNAGNRFRINVVSDVSHIDNEALVCVRNFFGKQRFGTINGPEIGKLLLEGNSDAASTLVSDYRFGSKLRRLHDQLGSWSEAFFHPEVSFDCDMFILQWQSLLWNTLLAELEGPLPDRLPMWRIEERERYRHLWDPGPLEQKAAALMNRFDRSTLVRPKNILVEQGYKSWDIGFDLPSGSYATVVLGEVFELFEPEGRQPSEMLLKA